MADRQQMLITSRAGALLWMCCSRQTVYMCVCNYIMTACVYVCARVLILVFLCVFFTVKSFIETVHQSRRDTNISLVVFSAPQWHSKLYLNWISTVIQTIKTQKLVHRVHTLYTHPMSQKTKLRKIYKSTAAKPMPSLSQALSPSLFLSLSPFWQRAW